MDKCTQFITQYCRAIKDCGSAGVIIAEPAAGLLSNEDCMQYSSVFVKRIVEEVQDSHFAVILHNCGNMGQCTQAMVATGAKGYHFGNKIDMLAALEECPSNGSGWNFQTSHCGGGVSANLCFVAKNHSLS